MTQTTRNTLTRCAQSAPFHLMVVGAILLPLTVEAQPALSVSPTSVTVQAGAGTDAPSQSVQISNGGNGALKWSVQEGSSWLSVSPTSGVNGESLTLTFQTSALSAGFYQTSFHIESNGGSSDVTVQVTVGSGGGTAPPPSGGTADISVSPTTVAPGGSVTVSFSGIASPTSTDWIALAPSGSSLGTYWDWKYAGSCTRTPGTARASGSCPFNAPATAGTYEFRVFANDQYTLLDRVTVTVTSTSSAPSQPPPPPSGVDISVSSTTPAPGSSVTVSFSGIANPSSTDWIALAPAGTSVNTYSNWKYAGSCTGTPGAAKTSGSCPFNAPTTAGSYEFRLFANDQYTLLDSVTVTVTTSASAPLPPPPPPPSSGYGPQSTITCPAGAVDIWPGTSIQSVVNNYGGNTTFCIKAGEHYLTSSITPKTGNTFVGSYGAILDGSRWSTGDGTDAAFKAHNQDIDYVTIRNLVIRNMPQRGIHAFYWMSDHWTIEYNEIASTLWGLVFASDFVIRNNNIHHNTSGGYLGTYSHNTTIENNEIAYNGREQKVGESANVTFRNNFVHHNAGDGIWYDSNNTGVLIEGNRVEDNGYSGIFTEISSDITVRNNTVRRSGNAGVFVSTSKNVQVYSNTLDTNFLGILYFVNCAAIGGGTIGFDLVNNSAHDNTVIVGTQSGAFANGFSYTGCTSTQAAAYLNGSKNLTFSRNTYDVPSPTAGQYWLWNGMKYWNEWQALGKDVDGVSK